MDVNQTINLQISYGIGIVFVKDVVNQKQYREEFTTWIPFAYLWFSKRAEKRAINKAVDFVANKIFEDHQKMMKL